jgi:hypothetical protein
VHVTTCVSACIAGQLHAQLLQVYDLLGKVSAMGPLVSLLKAHIVREEFLRTNRDLLDTFGILARGEQLLVSLVQQSCHMIRSRRQHIYQCQHAAIGIRLPERTQKICRICASQSWGSG